MQQKLNGKGKRVKGNLSLLIITYTYVHILNCSLSDEVAQ